MKSLAFWLLGAFFLSTNVVLAEDVVNTTEGVSGYVDAKHRNPVLSVGIRHVMEPKHVKIMADAYVPDGEFADYPIRFEFYINRKLFSTQIRSKELPGPVGVDIGADIAIPPFNYTVIATVVHPNHNFSTVLNGAVFESSVAAKLDCALALSADDALTVYEASGVEIKKEGNNALSLSFTGKDSETGNQAFVQAALKLSGEQNTEAAGSLRFTKDQTPQTIQAAGTISYQAGELSALQVESDDGEITLECGEESPTPQPTPDVNLDKEE